MGKLAREQSRCHWHFSRDLSYTLWQDGVSKEQRDTEKEKTRRLLAIELPEEDMEELKKMGVAELFGPGTPTTVTIDYIEDWFKNSPRNA